MMANNLTKTAGYLLCAFYIFSILLIGHLAFAQTWEALPPYNFLWPLWSSALSPIDPLTGVKAPLVNSLTSSTVLPLQPGIAWNPIFDSPYLLYNSPVGMRYYDPLYGINPWPPSYSIDSVTGLPISLTPPSGYAFLPPTDPVWIQQYVPSANLAYLAEYPSLALAAYTSAVLPPNLVGLAPWLASLVYPTPAFSSLLTPAQILGYVPAPTPFTTTAIVPPPLTAIAALPPALLPTPTTFVPPPTVVAPPPVAVVPPVTTIAAPPPTVVVPPPTTVTAPIPAVITTPGGITVIVTNPVSPNVVVFI